MREEEEEEDASGVSAHQSEATGEFVALQEVRVGESRLELYETLVSYLLWMNTFRVFLLSMVLFLIVSSVKIDLPLLFPFLPGTVKKLDLSFPPFFSLFPGNDRKSRNCVSFIFLHERSVFVMVVLQLKNFRFLVVGTR